jgi:hypothetical protein
MGKSGGINRRGFVLASSLALVARGSLLRGSAEAGGKAPLFLRNGNQYVAFPAVAKSNFGIEWGVVAGARGGRQWRPLAQAEKPLRLTYYEGVRPTASFSSAYHAARMTDQNTLQARCDWTDGQGNRWEIESTIRPGPAGFLLETAWKLVSGSAKGVSLQHAVRPLVSPKDAWSFIPGLLYYGNRADVIKDMPYCPYLTLEEMRKLGCDRKEVRVTDNIPRIDKGTDYQIEALATTATAPEVGVLNLKMNEGFLFGADPFSPLGTTGLRYLADPRDGRHEIVYGFPGVRARRYRMCSRWDTPPDRGAQIASGTTVRGTFSISSLATTGVPGLLQAFREVRARYRKGQEVPNVLPFSHAYKLIEEKRNTYCWREDHGYYRMGIENNEFNHVQMSLWGMSTVYVMLGSGDELTRQRALRMLNFMLAGGQAPSGLFYGMFNGDHWMPAPGWMNLPNPPAGTRVTLGQPTPGYRDPANYMAALSRYTTDTNRWGLKILPQLNGQDGAGELRARLEKSLEKAMDALQTVWRRDHDIGYLLDPASTEILWHGATVGTQAIGNLALGSQRLNRPDFLATAKQMADYYYCHRVLVGETYGGWCDIMNSLDSTSCGDLIDSFVILYEVTREDVYLDFARQAADLMATWVLAFNVPYPRGTMFARLKIHPLGAITASVQNLVGTPGMAVDSGSCLLRLYEYTGDVFYLELLRDILRTCPQMIVRKAGTWGKLVVGSATECLNASDHLADRGEAYLADCGWVQEAMMAAYVDVPGVYVEPEHRRITVIDHVEARFDGKKQVAITNATDYPAAVKVRIRGGKEEVVSIPAHQTRRVQFT